LSRLGEERALVVRAWALMPDRFRLLVPTAAGPVSMDMRSWMIGYAGYFNRAANARDICSGIRFRSVV
jgi:hypothetical protein